MRKNRRRKLGRKVVASAELRLWRILFAPPDITENVRGVLQNFHVEKRLVEAEKFASRHRALAFCVWGREETHSDRGSIYVEKNGLCK